MYVGQIYQNQSLSGLDVSKWHIWPKLWHSQDVRNWHQLKTYVWPMFWCHEDPFTPRQKLPDWKLDFMSQSHTYPLPAWSQKMFHAPVKMENMWKFSLLLLPDQDCCAVGQSFWKLRPKIIRQLRQEGHLWAKTNWVTMLDFINYWKGLHVLRTSVRCQDLTAVTV